MKADFDIAAAEYDQLFTNTPIGRKQRDRVWRYMRKLLRNYERARILELNCGTGEDAVFFAQMGHEVLATDISLEMLKEAEQKAQRYGLSAKIRAKRLDLAKPELEGEALFDVIFSNFGGLNCISAEQLERLADFCSNHLKVGGSCVFVVMPPNTLMEKWYRWWKGEKKTFEKRSAESPIAVSVGSHQVATYFHSQKDILDTFEQFDWKCVPTGFIPSYFNGSKWLFFLNIWEACLMKLKWNADAADHFLIHLKSQKSA